MHRHAANLRVALGHASVKQDICELALPVSRPLRKEFCLVSGLMPEKPAGGWFFP